jgi:hypothetical protein
MNQTLIRRLASLETKLLPVQSPLTIIVYGDPDLPDDIRQGIETGMIRPWRFDPSPGEEPHFEKPFDLGELLERIDGQSRTK